MAYDQGPIDSSTGGCGSFEQTPRQWGVGVIKEEYMRDLKLGLAVFTSAVALTAGPAWAQGGAGGGGGGGSVTPATPCASITSFGNSTGYYSVFAAIWTSFSVQNPCGGAVSWQMTYTNDNTGNVDFWRSGSFTGSGTGATIDEDWAAFSTPYTVTLTVSDNQGRLLDSHTALVTTKPMKDTAAG